MTYQLLTKELLLVFRQRGDFINPLLFFVLVITMVPLGVSPDKELLAELAPGMIWVVALLACLLSMDFLFRSDFEDGSLEQWLIMPRPLLLPVLIKVTVHWLATGIPLALFSPILATMLGLPSNSFGALIISLLLGTACFSLIGAIGASLTVALRRSSLLLSLIVMPLYIPVLIFGAVTVQNSASGLSVIGPLSILGAFLAFAIALTPFAVIAGLRIGIEG